jgi:Ca2+:H+ antiporter
VIRRLAFVAPWAAFVALVVSWDRPLNGPTLGIDLALLAVTIVAAVYHAEIVAQRVGEPFGTLILAIAVTVIEVALIVAVMVSAGPEPSSLARDTVFSAVMITCNGIIGLALLTAAFRHHIPTFNAEGSGAALATVAALATLTLVVPAYTTTTSGPTLSGGQLAYASLASLSLYGLFVFVQAIRHRDYFVPEESKDDLTDAKEDSTITGQPSSRAASASLGLLLLALVAVVGLAKTVSPNIEQGIDAAGLPASFVGVVIAFLILLPEGVSAVRAAWANQMQSSLNLALGSAMASIGLTIPVIAVLSQIIDTPLLLGLAPVQVVLFAITMFVAALTITPGRSTVMQGGVHLVLFAGFVVLSASP